jgi:hypothetical protein
VRCRCVPGRRCKRSPPVRSWRAARPRSVRAARRPRQRAAGNPAIGASVNPRRRQVVARQADRHRRPGGDRRAAGGGEPGLVPVAPTAGARSLAPRGPRIRPQPGSYIAGPAGPSTQESGGGEPNSSVPGPHGNPARAAAIARFRLTRKDPGADAAPIACRPGWDEPGI